MCERNVEPELLRALLAAGARVPDAVSAGALLRHQTLGV
jgi:hypothetical protein